MAELLSRLSAIYRRAIGQENRSQRCAPSKASVAEAMPDADVSRFCGGRSTSSMRRPSDVSSKGSAAGLRVIARPLKASSPCQQHIAHRESSHADNSSNRRTGSASMEGPTAASAAAGPTPASSAAVTVSTRATVSRPVASKSAAVCAPQALVLQQLQQLQQPLSLLEAKVGGVLCMLPHMCCDLARLEHCRRKRTATQQRVACVRTNHAGRHP